MSGEGWRGDGGEGGGEGRGGVEGGNGMEGGMEGGVEGGEEGGVEGGRRGGKGGNEFHSHTVDNMFIQTPHSIECFPCSVLAYSSSGGG